MKIGIDTSYFLYGFNIQISSIPQDCLDKIVNNPIVKEIYFSDFVIFELNAKASKVNSDCLDHDFKSEKLLELDGKNKFKICYSYSIKVWNIACILRKFHKDFIDCIHYATAIVKNCTHFLSEDKIIYELHNNESIRTEINGKFGLSLPRVINFENFLKLK